MDERERLLDLLRDRSLEVGDFVLSSGARSSYYIDCRKTTMHSEGQVLVGTLALRAIDESGLMPDVVGGLTMGADPVAYAIAHASWLRGSPINAFSVRKSAKAHGTGRRIEGCFEPGQRVIVIEDAITSGASALEACDAVETEGGEVVGVLALVDRESGGRTAIVKRGYQVITIFPVSELLRGQGADSTTTG